MAHPAPPLPTTAAPHSGGSVWDRSLLDHVVAINQRLLQALAEAARHGGSSGHASPLVGALAAEWRQLTPAAVERLAASPFLLLDGGFANPGFWQPAGSSAVQELAGRYGPGARLAPELVRSTLVTAWHFARANPLAARVMLGMSSSCASLLAAWRLTDIESIVDRQPPWVRPRWEEQPAVWCDLLQASGDGLERRLRAVQMRGVQLMAAALAPEPA